MDPNTAIGRVKAENLIRGSITREQLDTARKYVNQYKVSFPESTTEIQELEKLLKEQDIAIHNYEPL